MPTEEAVLVKVADGITAELAAALEDGDFAGLTFKPVMSYADFKDDELEDLDCLNVDVVPVSYQETELDARGSSGYLLVTDVAVRQKFGPNANGQSGRIRVSLINRLILLMQQLDEFFKAPDANGQATGRGLSSFPEASWNATQFRTTYSRRHLRDMRMFLGVIRVSYDWSKPL